MDTENKQEKIEKEKDMFSSFAEDVGIDKNIFDSLKPMIPILLAQIPMFFTQFIKGVPKFAEEEKRIQEMMRGSIKEKGGFLIQNIYSVRALLLTLTGFSLTGVGIVLSALLSNKFLFVNTNYLYIGLALLSFNIIGSIVYILYLYTIENNKWSQHLKFDLSLARELRDLLNRVYTDPLKNFDCYLLDKNILLKSRMEEENRIVQRDKKIKKDWWPHILSSSFLVGLIFIILSFFLASN